MSTIVDGKLLKISFYGKPKFHFVFSRQFLEMHMAEVPAILAQKMRHLAAHIFDDDVVL